MSMYSNEKVYLDLLKEVITEGEEKMDRTGVGTRSVFGRQLRFSLHNDFPLLTTKKIPWRPVLGELLWFVEGSSDERRLAEITFGTRGTDQKTIWSANAEYTTGSKFKPEFAGDLGRVYGVQWRTWLHHQIRHAGTSVKHPDGGETFYQAAVYQQKIDQLANIIDKIKTNPADRRMILTAHNVGEMDMMALPPCHMFAQFHTNKTNHRLNCLVYIRSNDLFLGLPFNIASYALLTYMIAHVTGYTPGELIVSIGDAHIYLNHLDQVNEQLSREPYPHPYLVLNPEITDIDKFTMADFKLVHYMSHDPIKAKMAV